MVIKSERKLSIVQFIDTALELEEFTIRRCKKFTKSLAPHFKDRLIDLSIDIANSVVMANSMLNDTKLKIERRTFYFDEAIRKLKCLITQTNVAKRLMLAQLSEYGWVHWMELIDKELSLLNALKKSDKEKLKTL